MILEVSEESRGHPLLSQLTRVTIYYYYSLLLLLLLGILGESDELYTIYMGLLKRRRISYKLKISFEWTNRHLGFFI